MAKKLDASTARRSFMYDPYSGESKVELMDGDYSGPNADALKASESETKELNAIKKSDPRYKQKVYELMIKRSKRT